GQASGGGHRVELERIVAEFGVEDTAPKPGAPFGLTDVQSPAGELEHTLCHTLHGVEDSAGAGSAGPPIGDGSLIEQAGTGTGEEAKGALVAESPGQRVEPSHHYPGPRFATQFDDAGLEFHDVGQSFAWSGVDQGHSFGDIDVLAIEENQGAGHRGVGGQEGGLDDSVESLPV